MDEKRPANDWLFGDQFHLFDSTLLGAEVYYIYEYEELMVQHILTMLFTFASFGWDRIRVRWSMGMLFLLRRQKADLVFDPMFW